MHIDHKHLQIVHKASFYILVTTKMVTLRNFDLIYVKHVIGSSCLCENYSQKLANKFYSY
jgi:hypothetical protein